MLLLLSYWQSAAVLWHCGCALSYCSSLSKSVGIRRFRNKFCVGNILFIPVYYVVLEVDSVTCHKFEEQLWLIVHA